MQSYIYRAELWCEECAQQIIVKTPQTAGLDPSNESSWDSDDYPKGPYPNGGGESDSPQHCAGCGLFLENPLTEDGRRYVREALTLPTSNPAILAQWSAFYGIRENPAPDPLGIAAATAGGAEPV